jgi:hypothetical protein
MSERALRAARYLFMFMELTIAKLRSDLERFTKLRAVIADPRTVLILAEIITEIETSLRRLENPEGGGPD